MSAPAIDLGRILALAVDLQDDIDRSGRPSVVVNRATLAEFVLETARLIATVEGALDDAD